MVVASQVEYRRVQVKKFFGWKLDYQMGTKIKSCTISRRAQFVKSAFKLRTLNKTMILE